MAGPCRVQEVRELSVHIGEKVLKMGFSMYGDITKFRLRWEEPGGGLSEGLRVRGCGTLLPDC
jgi:hypothetical protein